MNFPERRRTRDARMAQVGQDLESWVLHTARLHARDEGVELLVAKVRRERISRDAVETAFDETAEEHPHAFRVLKDGMAKLEADKPSHWR
jgi:hypothetical protein